MLCFAITMQKLHKGVGNRKRSRSSRTKHTALLPYCLIALCWKGPDPMELKWLEDFIAGGNVQFLARGGYPACDAIHVFPSHQAARTLAWRYSRQSRDFPAELTREGRTFLPVAQDTVRQFYNTRKALQPSREVQTPSSHFQPYCTLTVTFFPHWLKQIDDDVGGIRSLLGRIGVVSRTISRR